MDNINTVGDFIRGVFSTLVNKDDEIFKALLASDDPDKPGTMEKIFNDIEETRNKWCNTPNVYEQEGEMLEKTLSLFSVLSRAYYESNDSLKRRNQLLYIRNGDTVWGDYWDILKIFKACFETEFVYIVNNTNKSNENLLVDGDFEEGSAWVLENCAYDKEAGFSERNGVLFSSTGSCRQTVGVDADSTYFLHFFVSGIIDVEIRDNHGRYWNPKSGEFGEWQTTPCLNQFSTDDWDAESIFFLTDGTVESVTVNFAGRDGNVAYLDYVRLFKKENYPSFTLIVMLGERYTPDTIALAPGADDPINGVDYSAMSYIGQSQLLGTNGAKVKGIYTELLEIVKAGGVASYIEILTRDLDG